MRVQRLHRQPGVVDSTEGRPTHDNHREFEFDNQIPDVPPVADRNQQAADAFN